SAHGVTGVASFVLLANVGDQRLRMLHLHLQSGDQRVFSVNDNVTRFPLKFKANPQTAPVCSPVFNENSTIQLDGEVCLSFSIGVARARATLAVNGGTRKPASSRAKNHHALGSIGGASNLTSISSVRPGSPFHHLARCDGVARSGAMSPYRRERPTVKSQI